MEPSLIVHRSPPHAADAERGLLCSFLIAPKEIGGRCAETGITPASFHLPHHALIFELLQRLRAERMPIDFITLTTILRDQGKLDGCGGQAAITELFTYLPTAANATHYIEIIEEKHTLREIIGVCMEYADRSYGAQDDMPNLLDEVERKIVRIAQTRVGKSLRGLLASRRFDATKPPPEPVAVFKIGDATIATPGNILAIQSKAKAGKSAFIGALIAAILLAADAKGGATPWASPARIPTRMGCCCISIPSKAPGITGSACGAPWIGPDAKRLPAGCEATSSPT